MKQITLPDYAELSLVLSQTALVPNPSEAHGLICGVLCGGPSKRTVSWEELVTGNQELAMEQDRLQQLYDCSAQQLNDFLFEFQLVLPADSQALPLRAEALTLWCQGFLTGLKQVDVPLTNHSSKETTEAINDLIEIAKMNYEDVVPCEEDEAAFVELVEYVRMAVIYIYQGLHQIVTGPIGKLAH